MFRRSLAVKTLTLIAACLCLGATQALAGPTCSPSDASAQILGSATLGDIHPAWKSGKHVGYGWSLQVRRNVQDEGGVTYYVGDLYDTHGKLATRNVFAVDNEWDCGP